jgi:hypothetical protein
VATGSTLNVTDSLFVNNSILLQGGGQAGGGALYSNFDIIAVRSVFTANNIQAVSAYIGTSCFGFFLACYLSETDSAPQALQMVAPFCAVAP